MFLRFNILFLSLLFALNLWLSVSYAGYSGWLGIVFSLALVAAAELVVARWRHLVLPAILVPGSVLLLFLIDLPSEMIFFSVLATAIFYFALLSGWRLKHYERDETAKAMYNIAMIAALFVWYAAAFGWYLNIAFPVWVLLLAVASITFLAAHASFFVNQIEKEKRLIYGLFLAILVAQTVWVQNFWPFGYLTTSVITLIIYFVGWETTLTFFLKKLTSRAVFFEIMFLAGAVALVLLSTRWYPVI